jgi:alpha-tubulin suppressor-like RCC1 family protein
MPKRNLFLLNLALVGLLVACSSGSEQLPAPLPATTITSFGANPNPVPANIRAEFSWSVTGSQLTCAVDIDNNGSFDYTVHNCSSASRAGHIYGSSGSFTARLRVTGADGLTREQTTPVTVAAENRPPQVLSFRVMQGSSLNALRYTWMVSDDPGESLICRLDVDGDGVWEYQQSCNTSDASNQVQDLAIQSGSTERVMANGRYHSVFEVLDLYSSSRVASDERVPYNRAPTITSFAAVAGNQLDGRVSFEVSDPDGDPLSCALTVESIGRFHYSECTSFVHTYTFSQQDSYTVTLEVTDGYQATTRKQLTLNFSQTGPKPILFTQISAAQFHTCALGVDHQIYCWGINGIGQLGDGTYENRLVPTPVVMPQGVDSFSLVVAGGEQNCGLAAGIAYCWGRGGQVGDGTSSDQIVPTLIDMPTGVTFSTLVSGSQFTCALGSDNNAYCWGKNDFGQLGIGPNGDQQSPTLVTMPSGDGFTHFTQISGGYRSVCGLGNNDKVYCWGYNAFGQLGTNDQADKNEPTTIPLPAGVKYTAVSAGAFHSCALGDDNKAYCWGSNSSGQLGDSTTTDQLTGVAVSMPGSVLFTQIVAGEAHSCALGSDDQTYCWGDASIGQLGNGGSTPSSVPTAVTLPGGSTFTHLTALVNHTCALDSSGFAYCWGWNVGGQLGDNSDTNRDLPTAVVMPTR